MIIDDARALLATERSVTPVSAARSPRSFGLTNAERGRALRTTVALADDEDFEPTDPDTCWVCEGYCGTFDAIAETVVDALSGVEFETYQVGTQVPPLVEENERLLRGRRSRAGRRRVDETRSQSRGRPPRRREEEPTSTSIAPTSSP